MAIDATLQPLVLTVEEAANLLHTSRSSIFELVRRGDLKRIIIARKALIPLSEIESYVKRLLEEQG